MRAGLPDLSSPPDTLVAVVLGALLATISGVIANLVEARARRRERERAAALLMGEVVSTLRVVIQSADSARRIGDPYGPVTRRILHSARREIEFYERNRQMLLDLPDARLRVDLHNLIVRLSMPLEGILDSFGDASGDDRGRDQAFDFILANLDRAPDLVTRLGEIARFDFSPYEDRLAGPPPPRIRQTRRPDPPGPEGDEPGRAGPAL